MYICIYMFAYNYIDKPVKQRNVHKLLILGVRKGLGKINMSSSGWCQERKARKEKRLKIQQVRYGPFIHL